MRARLPVLFALCASILSFSTACSDAANPITAPKEPVALKPIASVAVAPATATLPLGGHVAMKATSTSTSGQPVEMPITWSSSDTTIAQVSRDGNVVAVKPGHAVIRATAGGAHADAKVVVSTSSSAAAPANDTTSAPAAPPAAPAPSDTASAPSDTAAAPSAPPAGSGASGMWVHEPSGFGTLTNKVWSSITANGWQEYDSYNHVSLVSDPTVPTGEANVLEFRYPQGFSGLGNGPGLVTYKMSKSEMYLGFYFKLSPNWEGHTSNVNKMFYLFQREGQNRGALIVAAYGHGAGPFRLEISNEASDNGQWFKQNVNNVRLVPGQWHKIEMHLRRSSSDAAPDGLVEWWIDGQLAARYPNAKLRGAPFSEIHIDPVWGGTDPSIHKTHADYQRFGSLHISGR